MAYEAVTVLMLISAPSDVPDEDLATVKRTVSQWNWNTGRPSHLTVVPVSWSEHAVAEFGDRPQEVLNGQLVEDADMALALFADRLGTPTGVAESGTLEEIDRMVEAGKHVSVLVNQAPRSLSGEAAVAEKGRLEEALAGLRKRAIVLPYTDQAMLAGHLNNMLSMAAGKAAGSASGMPAPSVPPDAVGVWPHVVEEPYQETDNKGRLKTKRHHYIELRNATGRPVFDVSITLPEGLANLVLNRDQVIERMAPGSTRRYPWIHTFEGSADADAVCTVTWRFDGEEPRQTQATVRA